MTRDEVLAALQAIDHELEANRLTIVRQVIDVNHTVIATIRRTVRLPRDSQTRESQR